MPAKKRQNEKQVQEPTEIIEEVEEPEETPEDQRFQKLENIITKKFETQMLQFQMLHFLRENSEGFKRVTPTCIEEERHAAGEKSTSYS